ncbi:MAG: hypothetical protein R6V05_06025, partial [Candidatus Brocadiia bacterium]
MSAELDALRRRIETLEARLAATRPPGAVMPGLWEVSSDDGGSYTVQRVYDDSDNAAGETVSGVVDAVGDGLSVGDRVLLCVRRDGSAAAFAGGGDGTPPVYLE